MLINEAIQLQKLIKERDDIDTRRFLHRSTPAAAPLFCWVIRFVFSRCQRHSGETEGGDKWGAALTNTDGISYVGLCVTEEADAGQVQEGGLKVRAEALGESKQAQSRWASWLHQAAGGPGAVGGVGVRL